MAHKPPMIYPDPVGTELKVRNVTAQQGNFIGFEVHDEDPYEDEAWLNEEQVRELIVELGDRIGITIHIGG